jgi:hypothetical protein
MCNIKRLYQVINLYSLSPKFGSSSLSVTIESRILNFSCNVERLYLLIRHFTSFIQLIRQVTTFVINTHAPKLIEVKLPPNHQTLTSIN